MATKDKANHFAKLINLGCIICKKLQVESVAEIHHIKNFTGAGRKESYKKTIPLCVYHHRIGKEAYHFSPKSFNKKWGSQEKLLKEVLKLIE